MLKQFIFGYGSIINSESVGKTTSSHGARPITIEGFSRSWNCNIHGHGQTAVGVLKREGSSCNGVLVGVDDLDALDTREIGYDRVWVKDSLWVYVPRFPSHASEEFPVMQSYIDVILEGCFAISDEFAREFIDSTDGWNEFIVNDRDSPMYPRALKVLKYKDKIDSLLKTHPKTKDFVLLN